jgi:predicted MFS family arabinose efflux permease
MASHDITFHPALRPRAYTRSMSATMPADAPATRLPSTFNRLAWSNLAAQAAEQVSLAAAPIVAVLILGAGAGATGLLQLAQTLPFLVLSVPAGVLADRVSRRGLMAGAEALRVGALGVILALVSLGLLTWPWLAVLGFVGVCGTVAFTVAAPALVPALVPAGALAAANGRLELARTVAFVAGPALAGALVARTGPAAAFGAAAALSACAALLLAGLHEPARPARAPGHWLDDVRQGARFVFGHTLLRPIFATQFVFNTAFFVLHAVYVPYAVSRLGLSASGVGATLAVYGIGLVAGAVLAPWIIRVVPFGAVIALGPVAGVVAAGVMLTTIWMPSALLAGLSFFLIGAGPVIWVISTATLRQTITPRSLLGRVSAINMLAYASRPLGAAIGAAVGGLYGAETCLVVAAAGFVAQAVIILVSPVARLAQQPEMVADV